jgi:hypothetical protein
VVVPFLTRVLVIIAVIVFFVVAGKEEQGEVCRKRRKTMV